MSEDRLSAPDTHKGQMQRHVLEVLRAHKEAGELPTSGRFVFYELEGRGIVRKSNRGESPRGRVGDPREQDVTDALTWVRDKGVVPWSWIVDETRTLHVASSEDYAEITVLVNIDPWRGRAPLILAESRSLGGVLSNITSEYECDIAATNGQVGGFLYTEVAPILRDNDRAVLYLGDWDHQGHQIEANTRRVLEHETGRRIEWTRVAITQEQITADGLTPVRKRDNRYRPPLEHEAWEAEALGQSAIVRLVRDALDELLPEPLADVHERERQERDRLQAILNTLDES